MSEQCAVAGVKLGMRTDEFLIAAIAAHRKAHSGHRPERFILPSFVFRDLLMTTRICDRHLQFYGVLILEDQQATDCMMRTSNGVIEYI